MGEAAFDEPFYISAWTLNELENIKTNHNKDDSVRYKARQMAKLLDQHRDDGSYTLEYDMMQLVSADEIIRVYPVAPETTDTKICEAANRVNNKRRITFCTDDICCKLIAHDIFNLSVCSTPDILSPDHYTGYKEVSPSPEDHAILYEHPDENIFCLIPNQYLIVHSDDAVDLFRWTGETHAKVDYKSFKTMMFDTVKAKNGDVYQKLAFDSLANNKITMLHGPAGTGKSYIAMAYMFKLLESHKIDKIIVFTNPCATTGAAKLGF